MTSNQAVASGGLFYLTGGSRVWFSANGNARPQIMVNRAANGGAVFAIGGYSVDCDDAVFGTGVNGNQATGGNGGAIYLFSTPLFADNCTFQNNQATGSGGAIFAFNSEMNIDSTFTAPDNRREGASDPADVQAYGCDPAGRCSSFHDNLADLDANDSGNGGAIYLSGGSLTTTFTYLYRNKAFRGGAIYQTSTAATTLENSLITANQATDILGGGIYSDNGTLSVTHVTIANNLGVGFFSSNAGSQATNSIAWGNTNGGFFNNFSASSSCNIDQSDIVGQKIDPQFIGGGSYQLSKTSPAINACTLGLGKDLNNRVRPIGPKFDMGAYEGGYAGVFLPMVRK